MAPGDLASPQPKRAGSHRERSREPEDLGAVLDALSRGRPWEAGLALGALGRNWGRVVGERLAVESEPASVVGGVLVVRASSAAWAAQIGFLAREIRGRANECLGREIVREVRVVLGGTRMAFPMV